MQSVLEWTNEHIFVDVGVVRLAVCIGWFIWISRNLLVFESESISPFKVGTWVKNLIVDLHCLSRPIPLQRDKKQPVSVSALLSRNSSGCLMMCDGAFDMITGSAAAACVLINRTRSIIDGVAKKVVASSVLVSEALAVRLACIVGAKRDLFGLVICSDSKEVISLASSIWSLRGKLKLSSKIFARLEPPLVLFFLLFLGKRIEWLIILFNVLGMIIFPVIGSLFLLPIFVSC